MKCNHLLGLASLPFLVHSFVPTDSIQDVVTSSTSDSPSILSIAVSSSSILSSSTAPSSSSSALSSSSSEIPSSSILSSSSALSASIPCSHVLSSSIELSSAPTSLIVSSAHASSSSLSGSDALSGFLLGSILSNSDSSSCMFSSSCVPTSTSSVLISDTVTSTSVPSSTSILDFSSSQLSSSSTLDSSSTVSTTSGSTSASASPTLGLKSTVGPYEFEGCYTEGNGVRALTGAVFYDYVGMTLEACATDCAGFAYFGVEYGGECWCGNDLDVTSVLAPAIDCWFTCPGDAYEYCGAGDRLELYSLSLSSSSSSLLPSSSYSIPELSTVSQSAMASIGSSLPSSSALVSPSTSSSLLLSSSNSIATSSSSFSSSFSSTMTSSSVAPTLTLNSLEPASISTFNYIGCFSDLVSNVRTLPSNVLVDPGMTLEMCAANCAGYDYFGTEYGVECYCGYTLSPTLRAAESDCDAACVGNSSEICGSGDRLSTYQNTFAYTPPPAPGHIQFAPVDFQWLSCYTEGSASRALTGPSFADDGMTVEACTTFCAGYAYAGVEYARECYCGDSITTGAVPAPVTDCRMLCGGNTTEYCGAGDRLDMYQFNPTLTSTSSIPTSSVGLVIAGSSLAAASSLSSTPTTLSTFTIPPSSSVPPNVVASSSSLSTTAPSTNLATTTSAVYVPTSTPLLSSTTPAVISPSGILTPPGPYQHLGCFQDLAKKHALPLLFTNNSVTPELCEAYVLSLANKPTPTILPYFAVEYHNECYGGATLSYARSTVTSLYGKHACTDVCSGSVGAKSTGTAMCGGRKQFNLYASGVGLGFQAEATVSV